MPASAVAAPGVGHRVERLEVPGAAPGELRQLDVHSWVPGRRPRGGRRRSTRPRCTASRCPERLGRRCRGRSRLRLAREGAALDPRGPLRADRVLARRDQRPDRLRTHAGGDRGRRVRGGRARRTPTTRRTTCGATTSTRMAPGNAGVRVRGRLAAPPAAHAAATGSRRGLRKERRPGQHVRPCPRRHAVLDALPGWFGSAVDARARA